MVVAVEYETVIGLEVHAQLLTRSKMFCSCGAAYQNAPPNTRVCPVCLGMPGVLPVINKRAVEYTIMTGLALNCSIAEQTKFDRKNYPYPDLMKGYQISQYDEPIAKNGWMDIEVDGQVKRVGITRVHLEEDVAKLLHRVDGSGESYTLMDVNRAGVPLMETVGEPDLRSPEEARQYLIKLRSILRYLNVSTCNMEEGSFRCDANISIRPRGTQELTTRTEVKNMNSFRSVFRALEYEVQRQKKVLERGERVVQETRGWVEDRGVTVSQRSKEHAHDYRYFPEPDLPPLVISRQWVEELRAALPELPDSRRRRLVDEFGLPEYDARQLTLSKATADFFEACAQENDRRSGQAASSGRYKAIANLMLGEMARLLNATGQEMDQLKVQPLHLVELLDLVDSGTLSTTMAKTVFEEMFGTGQRPSQVVEEKGLVQVRDTGAISSAVDEAIAGNPQAVRDYLGGKETAAKFLVGQVMRLTKGKADPGLVNDLITEKLSQMVER